MQNRIYEERQQKISTTRHLKKLVNNVRFKCLWNGKCITLKDNPQLLAKLILHHLGPHFSLLIHLFTQLLLQPSGQRQPQRGISQLELQFLKIWRRCNAYKKIQ